MAATAEFISLMDWIDENGKHRQGEKVSLPYESSTDKMDADRLVDYGVLRKVANRRRRKG